MGAKIFKTAGPDCLWRGVWVGLLAKDIILTGIIKKAPFFTRMLKISVRIVLMLILCYTY